MELMAIGDVGVCVLLYNKSNEKTCRPEAEEQDSTPGGAGCPVISVPLTEAT